MKQTAFLAAALLLLGPAHPAQAHEVRPGYLELRQSGPDRFEILWKVPARGELRLAIDPELPETCARSSPIRRFQAGGAYSEQWSVTCPGGLTGRSITAQGLAATLTDVLVRIQRSDGTTQVARLTPSAPSFVVAAAPSAAQVAGTYLSLGVEHILLGIDHLLFVLALLILVEGRRRLVGTVTAFTAAHSVTLAAATLGFVQVPQQPIEAVIALSIAFVAAEILHHRRGRTGLTRQWPWVVAFVFGLLHGFGFAGALNEIGLPEQAIPLSLLFFNLGVEVGQLLFIAAVLTLAALSRNAIRERSWIEPLTAYGIGSLAAYWTIDRVTGFWR